MRTLSDLTVSDFERVPVWELVDDAHGNTVVRPVRRLPVRSLKNRVIGTRAHLADGSLVWVVLGNIALNNPRSTRQFLSLAVHSEGQWFDLARYHDADYHRRDSTALAAFLGRKMDQVFPIVYDISSAAMGSAECLIGKILESPSERLNQDELIQLSLQSD